MGKRGPLGTEATFVYLAFCPLGDGTMFVKVGISITPLTRMFQVHAASPIGVRRFKFVCVGNQSQARRAESQVLKTFQPHITRGEWLRVPVSKGMVSGLVKEASMAAFKHSGGRAMPWRSLNPIQVRDAVHALCVGALKTAA